ncbi:MAG: glutamate 5-kinase, partial [Lentisphaeria bacterium]|nr:glutamate 5-kinase [Lentisphaeria bacterium]
LPGGVLGVSGAFRKGEPVQILNARREEIARGIANFSSDELARVCGAKSAELQELLGHPVESPEAVHKDFLVLRQQHTI